MELKMDLQPTLENDLVLLRPLNHNDLEDLYEVAKDPLIWEQHHSNRFDRHEFDLFFKNSSNQKELWWSLTRLRKK